MTLEEATSAAVDILRHHLPLESNFKTWEEENNYLTSIVKEMIARYEDEKNTT
jgi:hypothetical protein